METISNAIVLKGQIPPAPIIDREGRCANRSSFYFSTGRSFSKEDLTGYQPTEGAQNSKALTNYGECMRRLRAAGIGVKKVTA